jgi:tetratricopeptide (TPR) repeat protein
MGVLLAGCETLAVDPVPTTVTVQDPLDVKYYPSDQPLKLGMEHFGRGSYGLAEQYFRDAVEKAPRDLTAWVGLAASYDRLRRFELADQAYSQAFKLQGKPSIELLSNYGYSMMLRGNLKEARRNFLRALSSTPQPGGPGIISRLLNSSYRYIQRLPASPRQKGRGFSRSERSALFAGLHCTRCTFEMRSPSARYDLALVARRTSAAERH